jgi:hypothetical protein
LIEIKSCLKNQAAFLFGNITVREITGPRMDPALPPDEPKRSALREGQKTSGSVHLSRRIPLFLRK